MTAGTTPDELDSTVHIILLTLLHFTNSDFFESWCVLKAAVAVEDPEARSGGGRCLGYRAFEGGYGSGWVELVDQGVGEGRSSCAEWEGCAYGSGGRVRHDYSRHGL